MRNLPHYLSHDTLQLREYSSEMPAKHDWSWVSDVDNASEITDDHRLRAAGLKRLNKCPFAFSLDPDVIPVKDRGCTKRRCTGNPACLNYLGVETLLDEKGKKKFVDDKLVTMTAREDSPAGLKNLGATCYVSNFMASGYRASSY